MGKAVKKLETEEKTHALLSPSSGERWMNCTGFILDYSKTERKELSNSAAVEGNRLHSLAELELKKFITSELALSDNIDENILAYVKYVSNRFCEFQGMYLGECQLYVEQHLEQQDYSGSPVFRVSGTVDCIIVTPDFLEIIDLKTGFRKVSAEKNIQLGLYGLMAAEKFNKPVAALTIVQKDFVDQWGDLEQVNVFQAELKKALTVVQNNLNAGRSYYALGSWCEYCPLRYSCKTFVGDLFPAVAQLPDPFTISEAELGKLYAICDFLTEYFKTVEKEVNNRVLKDNRTIPGYKVIQGPGRREWAKEPEEILEKLVSEGFNERDLTQLKPFTHIEKLGKKAKELVETLVHKKEGAYKVVTNETEGEAVVLLGDDLPAIETT